MKTSTVAILIVIILSVLAFVFLSNKKDDGNSASNGRFSTYQNTVHGYSLSYPKELQVREYSPDTVSFGNAFETRILTVSGQAGETIQEAITTEMISLCAADSPSITISCSNAEQVQPFMTKSGTEGITFYLRGERKDLRANTTSTIGKGPYFAFPIQTSATASKVLVVHPPLNQNADESDSVMIRTVAESVVLIKSSSNAQETPIQEYIRANIASLSSETAVLGGTLFVTDIEASGGTGIVKYENGHNAYIADFTYTTDASGRINVTSFRIR